MTKAYWVAHVDIGDQTEYARYREANAAAFDKFGARFLVRGGAQEQREGHCRARTVVIEFPSLEAARACYDSPEYAAARAIRTPVSEADLIIVEGHSG